ncbi:TOBE domain-containing protein [Syntrophomonas wolfei]
MIPRGSFYKVDLDVGIILTAVVTGQALEKLNLEPGQSVWVV